MGNSPTTTTVDTVAPAVQSPVDTALDTLTRCLVLAINLESTAKTAKTDKPSSDSAKSTTAST
ncbi:hypothetical protein PRIPAC_86756 [Pristionchus pacificus]|uniref:Uncharacterized protein n=1 Tax=Pristionchus pacificus TaxID=54126 RepID=A0A454XVN6_PRIPA|nr:hypothetical protein PRIPAC_86756 [Pristionchus pacificus]|eukprot:PDM68966.1 hypothetical protein PRIPAC_47268 [Pristionchus pacificus]